MRYHLEDEFFDPASFNVFQDPKLPDFLSYSDFTIFTHDISDQGSIPMPVLDENGAFTGIWQQVVSTVFDERPRARLADIERRDGKIIYVDVHGMRWNLPNMHVRLSVWHPKLWWVGARFRPSILEAAQETTTAWWWKFQINDPLREYPMNHVQGGYVFEKETDAICFRALLDVLNK